MIFGSLTTEYSLFCERHYLKEWGIFVMLFGGSLVSLLFTFLEDIYGKKRVLMYSFFLCIGFLIFMFLCSSIYLKVLSSLLILAICQIVNSTAYMLINELTTGRIQRFANTFFCVILYFSGLLGNFLPRTSKIFRTFFSSSSVDLRFFMCWYFSFYRTLRP